jgi:hypothetical protein
MLRPLAMAVLTFDVSLASPHCCCVVWRAQLLAARCIRRPGRSLSIRIARYGFYSHARRRSASHCDSRASQLSALHPQLSPFFLINVAGGLAIGAGRGWAVCDLRDDDFSKLKRRREEVKTLLSSSVPWAQESDGQRARGLLVRASRCNPSARRLVGIVQRESCVARGASAVLPCWTARVDVLQQRACASGSCALETVSLLPGGVEHADTFKGKLKWS